MTKELLLELDPDERVIRQTKRHIISSVFIVIVAGFLFVVALAALFLGIRNSQSLGIQEYEGIFALSMMLLLLLIALFAWAAVYLDRKNELVVTNENIMQVLQFSLFNKQVSQLNLAKIQDVSVDQNGILAHAFNFGIIEIETAGEVANFRFIYVPDPNLMAKAIIEAHEDYIKNLNTQNSSGRI
jgi:hypothetical protein